MMRPDWDKITEEAFNSEEVHDFSADYCRRRAELQGGTSMETRRITQKTRRFNTRLAATAAGLNHLISFPKKVQVHFGQDIPIQ